MKNKSQSIRILATSITITFFLLLTYGCGNKDRTNIQSEEEIRSFIKGKWSSSQLYNGYLAMYRFEITDTQIKFWQKGDIMDWNQEKNNWKDNPDEIINYQIGSLETDSNGNKKRVLAEGKFGQIVIQSGNQNDNGWIEQVLPNGEENTLFRGWKEN